MKAAATTAARDGLTRRHALQAGGLAIAFTWLGGAGKAFAAVDARHQPEDDAAAAADGNPPFAPNAFVRVDADGGVRLVMPMVEMGQAIYTGSAMLVAEELGIGMDQLKVEHSPPNEALYGMPLLGGQITGGSTSTRGTYDVLREAGAVARTLLVSAAAAQWQVDPAGCSVARGVVTHAPSGRQLGYGALAAAAARLPMPEKVALKAPKDYEIIGRPLQRVDSPDKVRGATQFGLDVRVPGMKIAAVKACPTLGGLLQSVDDKAARAIPGVVDVIRLPNAVAVVGEHFWAARQGLDALVIDWTPGQNAGLDTPTLRAALAHALANDKSIVAREVGQRPSGGTLVEATYQSPMLAHATMEPLNTTVHVTPTQCEIWCGTQVPARCVAEAAKITGLAPEKIVLHNQYLGGGFGRRLETDSVEQAVALAKQVPYPLKVVWTREEDIRHDIVRPMYHDDISALVDGDGRILWFGDRISGGTVLGRWAPGAMKDGLDSDTVESAAEPPYELPNLKVEWVRHDMPPGLLVGWWRGVGPTHNLFVVESFIDELAHRAGKDPVAYRRAMLQKNPRTLAVLDLAAAKIGWGQGTLPPRVGRGVALGDPFGSRVCAIVEAEVTPQGEVRLRRAVVAIDCGIAINAGSLEAQIQGGLLFGLSAALYSEITIKDGQIQQSNFHDYRTLRIDEAPTVEVYAVHNLEAPGGLGEVGTAIAAPALSNAIFAASGVRLRELPVRRALLAQGKDVFKQKVATADPSDPAEPSLAGSRA